jgi:hypothetical protein
MITDTTFRLARTALTNVLGREPMIASLASVNIAGMDLIFGVIMQDGERATPFSMRLDRLDPHLWTRDVSQGENASRYAQSAILDLITGIAYGNEKNPHA